MLTGAAEFGDPRIEAAADTPKGVYKEVKFFAVPFAPLILQLYNIYLALYSISIYKFFNNRLQDVNWEFANR